MTFNAVDARFKVFSIVQYPAPDGATYVKQIG